MVDIIIICLISLIVILLGAVVFLLICIKKILEKMELDLVTLNNVTYAKSKEPTKQQEEKEVEETKEEPVDPIGSVFGIVDDLLSGKTSMDEVNKNES